MVAGLETSGERVRSFAADWCCRWLLPPRALVLQGEERHHQRLPPSPEELRNHRVRLSNTRQICPRDNGADCGFENRGWSFCGCQAWSPHEAPGSKQGT